MTVITLNKEKFDLRVKQLSELAPLIIALGSRTEASVFNTNNALFLFLLEYEFPETVILILETKTVLISTKKRTQLLSQVQSNQTEIVCSEKENVPSLVKDYVKDRKVGVCYSPGEFCESIYANLTINDVEKECNRILNHKEEAELDFIEKSAHACNFLANEAIKILREDPTCSLLEKLEELVDDPRMPVDSRFLDFIFPIEYSDSAHPFLYIGMRFKGFCSEIGRTFLINASPHEKEIYLNMGIIRDNILSINKPFTIEEVCWKLREKGKLQNLDLEISISSTGIKQRIEVNKTEDIDALILDIKETKTGYRMVDTILVREKVTLETKLDDTYIETVKTRKVKKEVETGLQRVEHQRELMDKLIDEMVEYYKKTQIKEEKIEKEELICYQNENLLPRNEVIYIDERNFCICIPLNYFVVPIHVTQIKNVIKTENGLIRVNLLHVNDNALRSISYKTKYADDLIFKINELKKIHNLQKDKIEQEENLIPTKGRRFVLPNVYLKTDLTTRKSKAGDLALHENGFLFASESVKIELLFKSIKHMFFQEGTIENRTILHFNLSKPLIVGKKTNNVQFYREAGTNTVQDTSKIKNDEYMESLLEKEEEEKRRKSNSEFSLFCDNIEKTSSLRTETPLRGLWFYGVPFKGNVIIQPTRSCLINLIETPFFISELSEIEIVCFERVIFHIKTCDMTIIYRNKTFKTIQNIEFISLQSVKDFLDSKNIAYIETKVNIQWATLIKEIMKDPVDFYNSGAWSELQENRESISEEESESEITESSEESESVHTDSESEEEDEEEEDEEEEEEEEDEEEEEEEEDDESERYEGERKKRKL